MVGTLNAIASVLQVPVDKLLDPGEGRKMSRTVWCDDLQEGHVWDERKAIVLTTDVDTFHFCAKHLSTAFTAVLNHAEQRGMCEIFVPSYGGFELKTSGPRQRPAAEGKGGSNGAPGNM
jgi:hypothetical protein